MKKRFQPSKKTISILLTILLMVTALPTPVLAAPAATPAEAVFATISSYYTEEKEAILEDWEELAALAAAGEDLSKYKLPETPASGSTAVIVSLIKGDIGAAKTAATGLVSGAALTVVGYAYSDALNVIAIEAYNRSVSAGEVISYDKEAAAATLLSYKETDDGFGDGPLKQGTYDFVTGDPDTTGMVLVALSLYSEDSGTPYYASVATAISAAISFLHTEQQANGGFSSMWAGNNANSAAVVSWGLSSVGEDPAGDSWKKGGISIQDALLSFYVSGGGFDTNGNTTVNSYATKQAVIAFADADYFKTFIASPIKYLSSEIQIVKPDGSYTEKSLTVKATATEKESVAQAAERALGVSAGSISIADYHCFVNKTAVADAAGYEIQEGDEILLVENSFTSVAYFMTTATDELGVNTATIDFGTAKELTLVQAQTTGAALSGVPMPGIPVDTDGDGYSNGSTDALGKIAVSPIEAKTYQVAAIRSEYAAYPPYDLTEYITGSTAILPAKIIMEQGATQTATVKVRVEGINSNVAYAKTLTVGNNGTKKITAWDAIKTALDSNNVPYVWTGSYLSSINAVGAAAGGGWMYVINGAPVWLGMNAQTITSGDEIVVYYCNSTWNTVYPTVTSSLSANGSVVLTIRSGADPLAGVGVSWAAATSNAYTTNTAIDGTVTIPAAKAPVGSHSLQISKLSAGLPDVIRLAPDYAITISSSGAGDSGSGEVVVDKVAITVIGPSNTLLSRKEYSWYNGMTPLSVLKSTGLAVQESGGYVSSIEGIEEFAYGSNSGWLYKVNGDEGIKIASNTYKLDADDELIWYYTKDYIKNSAGGSVLEADLEGSTSVSASAAVTAREDKSTGLASATLSGATLTTFNKDLSAGDEKKNSVALISVAVSENAKGVKLALPEEAAAALCKTSNTSFRIETSFCDLTFDEKAIAAIDKAAAGKGLTFSMAKADTNKLSESNKSLIGDRPVYDFTLEKGNSLISSFGEGSVSISIPYTPAAGEDKDAIVVYYIDDSGMLQSVRGGYNEKSGKVDFSVTHFSEYAIAYNKVSFADVPNSAWYAEAVNFIAARGISTGTGNAVFSPQKTLKRGEFVVMLLRAYGIEEDKTATDNFADAGDTYYTNYLATAKRLGISAGIGDNNFAPEREISRQDLFLLLYRALTVLGIEEQGATVSMTTMNSAATNTTSLASYSDKQEIASYALSAMEHFVKSGVVSGNKGKLDPKGTTTRAQMAQVLYQLLKGATKATEAEEAETLSSTIQKTSAYLIKKISEPTVNSVGGEWTVVALARSTVDVPNKKTFLESYDKNATAAISESKGILTTNKYTEYSRVILAMTARGSDPAKVGGYDLLAKLADFEKVKKQGINGPVYALIALDSDDYSLQAQQTNSAEVLSELTTREGIIEYILAKEIAGGGFALGESKADPDVTAMALQALAGHKDQKAVSQVIERALLLLSKSQAESGAILFSGAESSESTAQLIIALTALGIDPETDSRFVKQDSQGNKKGLVTALLGFAEADGSFCHLRGGNADLMATEQALVALVSYERYLAGKTPIFEMEDQK